MKKFLALVLALVMTMSLVTVAGAKDFTDAADIQYEEAVAVLSEVGVVDGYTKLEDKFVDFLSEDLYYNYWNDWKGLVRETVTISFIQDGKFNIDEDVKTEILYAYDCGIRY